METVKYVFVLNLDNSRDHDDSCTNIVARQPYYSERERDNWFSYLDKIPICLLGCNAESLGWMTQIATENL